MGERLGVLVRFCQGLPEFAKGGAWMPLAGIDMSTALGLNRCKMAVM